MGVLGFAIPVALAIMGGSLFYMANKYRDEKILGRFELYFNFGFLLIVSSAFVLYSTFDFAGSAMSEMIGVIFHLFIWVAFLLFIFLFMKMVINIMRLLIKTARGKGNEE